jgi:hypothetical protein
MPTAQVSMPRPILSMLPTKVSVPCFMFPPVVSKIHSTAHTVESLTNSLLGCVWVSLQNPAKSKKLPRASGEIPLVRAVVDWKLGFPRVLGYTEARRKKLSKGELGEGR